VTVPDLRSGPPLARGGFDRVAHRRRDAQWQAAAWERSRIIVVDEGKVLVRDGVLVLLDPASAPEGERYFLGVDDSDVPYFAVAAELPTVDGARPATIREVGHSLPELEGGLFITAVALANWHVRHPYSPVSGALTTPGEAGWTRVTGDGTEILWPRTDPAVIVVVHDGVPGPDGRCLLGANAAWISASGVRRYSCLAGFVEPGESAESTVAREVAEEVGVTVSDIRYVASQPWPFPGSLMLGFTARTEPGAAVRLDPEEMADARWFTRIEIAATLAGQRSDFGLPMAASIAHFLIAEWVAGRA
jgi:NAD+ diphosphatase